jgi:hypothetical protein
MSTAPVFLDIEKAFDTTWHNGLLYTLSKMNFLANLIRLSSFLSNRTFSVSVEGKYTKDNESRGSTRFSLVPYTV